MDGGPETIHATAIALSNKAALIRGPSGSGKSDLALRCITQPASAIIDGQAVLISDDRVTVEKRGDLVLATPPEQIAGLLELRGLGLYRVPFVKSVPISLIVDLVESDDIERLPVSDITADVLGVRYPLIKISAFECSAPSKLLMALSGAERLVV